MREDFRQFARCSELWGGLMLVIASPIALVVGIATGAARPAYVISCCAFGTIAGAYFTWKGLRAKR